MKSLEALFSQTDLTNKQRTIADYILSVPDEVAYLTLKELKSGRMSYFSTISTNHLVTAE